VAAEPTLQKLEYQFYEHVYKNANISRACSRLEEDIANIEQSLGEDEEREEEEEMDEEREEEGTAHDAEEASNSTAGTGGEEDAMNVDE